MLEHPPGPRLGRDDVCAVIVTFHPDAGFPARLGRIRGQVGATVVVDNGSAAPSLRMLEELPDGPALHRIFNRDNLGIARALNIGVARARQFGCGWALLLDQDSTVDPDLVTRLMAVRAGYAAPEPLALIGSRFRETHGGASAPLRSGVRTEDWEDVKFVITSGCLLSLAAYAVIGAFRDEFFIDHVDIDYCHRARAKGYRVIQTVRPLMSHTIGAPTPHRLFGTTRWTTNHSPDRRYYMARNDTVLLHEHGGSGRSPWWLKSFFRSMRLIKRIALYEDTKARKIAAVAEGWWDGVRGRLGPRRHPPG